MGTARPNIMFFMSLPHLLVHHLSPSSILVHYLLLHKLQEFMAHRAVMDSWVLPVTLGLVHIRTLAKQVLEPSLLFVLCMLHAT